MHLAVTKEIGDKKGERAAYGNLGPCYIHLRQYDKAIKYQESYLDLEREIGDKNGEGTAYGHLRSCHISPGQRDRSIKHQEMDLPSLSVAKQSIGENPEEPAIQGRPLIVGDPCVGELTMGDEVIRTAKRLPCAKKEVQVVGEMLNVKPLVGKRATKRNFLKKIESANLIHIASCGQAQREGILFTPCPERDRESLMLTSSDLQGKRIKAKLVVLSCCRSGRSEAEQESMVGIARAFLKAGARAVLVTLCSVDDVTTLCFMRHFYLHLVRGESANAAKNGAIMEAVRDFAENTDTSTEEAKKAMTEMMMRHRDYWAPLALLGDKATSFGE